MTTLEATTRPGSPHGYLDAATRGIFPLRLTPFEHYMLLDGAPGAWMVFTVIIEAAGTVDRDALQDAAAFATGRNPLCLATVTTDFLGRNFWSLEHDHQPEIYWCDNSPPPAAWSRQPDLTAEVGVRVLVEQQPDQATITVKFHHAVTDGVGSGQWIDDFLVRYATLTGPADSAPPQPIQLDVQRLLDRRRHRLPLKSRWAWLWHSFLELFKHFFQVPRPLQMTRIPNADADYFSGIVTHRFTADETQQLRRIARDQDASLNACLLCDLFRAIVQWNAADEKSWFRDPWYRINMPLSMREGADLTSPAANFVGLTFLHRRRSTIAVDREHLLRSVEEECESIKRSRRGTLFLATLSMIHAIPGLLYLSLSVPLCLCTAVLTNLGDPTRRMQTRFPRRDGLLVVGNLLITGAGGAPTLRRHTNAAISVNTYCDQLTFTLHMNTKLFTREDAERFLEIYVAEIRSSLS